MKTLRVTAECSAANISQRFDLQPRGQREEPQAKSIACQWATEDLTPLPLLQEEEIIHLLFRSIKDKTLKIIANFHTKI